MWSERAPARTASTLACVTFFLLAASEPGSAQLFENLEAFGRRLDVGDPGVEAHFAREGPKGIAMGDLDGDGTPDLAVSNLDGTVTVYLDAGDGQLTGPVHLHTGKKTLRGIALADLTGDGLPEIITAAPYDGALVLFVNRGKSPFAGPLEVSAWRGARDLESGDFDGTGAPEIVLAGPHLGLRQYRVGEAGGLERVPGAGDPDRRRLRVRQTRVRSLRPLP